ncbi:DNA-directed RNA polymerase subunit H [uncultured archaeon]|nr:DNA-directed RNA polymerase subunit H [uncultured archaeon]
MAKKKQKVELDIDIFGHFLVPKMEILSEAEKKNLLKKYNIPEHNLPKMKSSDAAARKLKAEPGDVVKIEREDPTAKYSYYRLVV